MLGAARRNLLPQLDFGSTIFARKGDRCAGPFTRIDGPQDSLSAALIEQYPVMARGLEV
jgi:hypothetical protein